MKSTWYTPKEITQMSRMPKTIQGVHKKAKREGWEQRRKLGIQGPAVEYCLAIESEHRRHQIKEDQTTYRAYLQSTEEELERVWMTLFKQLSAEDRALLITNIIKCGVTNLIKYQFSLRAEKMVAMMDALPSVEQEAIFNFIETKQRILQQATAASTATGSATVEEQ